MKMYLMAFASFVLLFSCTPEKTPGGDNNNNGGNSQSSVVELTGITISEHVITLEKGGNKVLYVKFTPDNATNKTLTWVSSNTSIITVMDGIVVGVAPGTTEVIAKSGNLTDKCQVTVICSATSVSLDPTELNMYPGETATIKATVLPEDSTDKVEWSSLDESIVTVKDGEVTAVADGEVTITANAGEKTSTCHVKVIPIDAIDLGLSVYWAKCNLGASAPEKRGDYYAWGEVEPYYSSLDPVWWKNDKKSGYEWASYKWCNGYYNTLTKYCPADKTSYWNGESSPDGKIELEPADDVAHVTLGGKWRIPTDAEWTEIMEKCTWTWTSQNGNNGRLVTGPNGNSIFLPAAGYWTSTDRYSTNSYGCYWSSSINTDTPSYAWHVGLSSDNVRRRNDGYRHDGFSIRPVTE